MTVWAGGSYPGYPQTVVLVGKQGPAFGESSSFVELEFLTLADTTHGITVFDFIEGGREDTLRFAFAVAGDTVSDDGEFGGGPHGPQGRIP